jgi:hypothetical protein
MKDASSGMKMAFIILLLTFGYLIAVVFFPMTKDGAEQAKTITPFLLGSVIGTLIGFYYGNKSKSQDQTPPDTTVDDNAKSAAAKIETDRIAAAKNDADAKETARLAAAQVVADKVIEKAAVKAPDTAPEKKG